MGFFFALYLCRCTCTESVAVNGIIGTNKSFQFTVQVEDLVKSCWLGIVWLSLTQRSQVRGIFSWYKKEAFFENERGQWFDAPKFEWGSENVRRTTHTSREVSIIPADTGKLRQTPAILAFSGIYHHSAPTRNLPQQFPAFLSSLVPVAAWDYRHLYYHMCQYLPENACIFRRLLALTGDFPHLPNYAGVCRSIVEINRSYHLCG